MRSAARVVVTVVMSVGGNDDVIEVWKKSFTKQKVRFLGGRVGVELHHGFSFQIQSFCQVRVVTRTQGLHSVFMRLL